MKHHLHFASRRNILSLLSLLLTLVLISCQQETKSGAGEEAVSVADSLAGNSMPAQEPDYTPAQRDSVLRVRAQALAQTFIIVDGHVDLPYRLQNKKADISKRTEGGDFDWERAREGGLDAPFMSIYIPAAYEERGGGRELADRLISMVEQIASENPDKFALANSPEDVRRNFEKGLISLPMGMENGTPVGGKLENLDYFYKKGIRYITLAHSKSNHISDSSYDPEKRWGGLSPFGREVVRRMNSLGIMVDVSHISDSAFYQVLQITKAPVVATHSSARHFTPGFERNMSDEMIKALARNKGVMMVNFGSAFISDESRKLWDSAKTVADRWAQEQGLSAQDDRVSKYREQYFHEQGGRTNVQAVADHIDHVVKLVGIEHVGLGSDFDGVGDTLPEGLTDVSDYPNLIYELLKRGYSEDDIRKIASDNIFRVWREVEKAAGNTAVQ
ncbi:dipeptidase [Cesiribacter sp. SM1]|uniref:dipeptidase n=1 Tax=Cesiribacter sp. SM1 TaxID=2861196 RepID=UPI001CD79C84|nr:dipeptidase [Cesiribacter sp. SM1]